MTAFALDVSFHQQEGTKSMTELWKDLKYPGKEFRDYLISTHGRVKSLKRETAKILNSVINKTNGGKRKYRILRLLDENGDRPSIIISRGVLASFVRKPKKGEEANHLDGNPLNDRLDNLEWVDRKGNAEHAWETGLYKSRGKYLSDETWLEILERHASGEKQRDLAKEYGISTITHIIHGLSRPEILAAFEAKHGTDYFWGSRNRRKIKRTKPLKGGTSSQV